MWTEEEAYLFSRSKVKFQGHVLYIKFWHFNPCGHDYGNLIISFGQDYGNLESFMLNEMGIFNTKLLYDVFACES